MMEPPRSCQPAHYLPRQNIMLWTSEITSRSALVQKRISSIHSNDTPFFIAKLLYINRLSFVVLFSAPKVKITNDLSLMVCLEVDSVCHWLHSHRQYSKHSTERYLDLLLTKEAFYVNKYYVSTACIRTELSHRLLWQISQEHTTSSQTRTDF